MTLVDNADEPFEGNPAIEPEMKEISYCVIETICTQFFIKVTEEEEEALKKMSDIDAREFLYFQDCDDCKTLDIIDSNAPHEWEDSDGEDHYLEERY